MNRARLIDARVAHSPSASAHVLRRRLLELEQPQAPARRRAAASAPTAAASCACALPTDAAATTPPGCGAFEGDEGRGSCYLDCGGDGAVCPEGMACRSLGDVSVCAWELVITLPGYGDCADNPQSTCQPGEDACLTDAGGTGAACSESGCAAAGVTCSTRH